MLLTHSYQNRISNTFRPAKLVAQALLLHLHHSKTRYLKTLSAAERLQLHYFRLGTDMYLYNSYFTVSLNDSCVTMCFASNNCNCEP